MVLYFPLAYSAPVSNVIEKKMKIYNLPHQDLVEKAMLSERGDHYTWNGSVYYLEKRMTGEAKNGIQGQVLKRRRKID